jgi:glycosyltransferase involved in cell wall biosynthesis
LRICFLDSSTKLETVNDLETRARGGMVTSLFKVSDYLSRQGHGVWVYSDIKTPGTTEAGTRWINWNLEGPVDFLVCNRGINGFGIEAKHRILWTHDLPHAGHIPEPKNIKSFSATVFMSEYAERIWRFYYRDLDRSFLIPNGVDKSIFYPREKDLNYIIYASAPNRGLKELPFLFSCLKEKTGKPLYLKAFSNMSKLHPNEVGEVDDYEDIYEDVRNSEIELCDPIPQTELAEELGKASLMILPTSYPEICSNTILQALASGVPVVTTGCVGSSSEWVNGKNGALTEWLPHDYMVYKIDLLRKATGILQNENLHRKLIEGCTKTKIHTWDEIGELWEIMLDRLF